jgi:hypothetical protein
MTWGMVKTYIIQDYSESEWDYDGYTDYVYHFYVIDVNLWSNGGGDGGVDGGGGSGAPVGNPSDVLPQGDDGAIFISWTPTDDPNYSAYSLQTRCGC